MMDFPHHTIPDGTILAPHHFYYGVAIAAVVVFTVWDDQNADPWVVLAGLAASSVGFVFGWPQYAVFGALLTLSGLAVSTFALFRPFWWLHWKRALLVYFGLLVAWDDVIEHAFGVPTPLDTVWVKYIAEHMA